MRWFMAMAVVLITFTAASQAMAKGTGSHPHHYNRPATKNGTHVPKQHHAKLDTTQHNNLSAKGNHTPDAVKTGTKVPKT